jgi:hypothetical protein
MIVPSMMMIVSCTMMIVRPVALREFLRAKGASQVSEEALVLLAAACEERTRVFAEESIAALEERNAARDVQRIPRLRRLTVADVEEALRRLNGKS